MRSSFRFDMKILLCANNIVGLEVARYLKKENIIALGIHAPKKQVFTEEIKRTIRGIPVLVGQDINDEKLIKQLIPDIIICAFWAYILKSEILKIPKFGCINFHPSLVPYNRGMNPNVWPFIDGTPAGVTIHYMVEKPDAGDVIIQEKVDIEPVDTAGSLDDKLHRKLVELFKEVWPLIKENKAPRTKQIGKGTRHLLKDVNKLDRLNKSDMKVVNKLRARNFRDRTYSYFIENGRKVKVYIKLKYV